MRAALEHARDALIKIGFEPEGRLLSPILAALALPSEPSGLVRLLIGYRDDPMWDAHAEVPKSLLTAAIEALSSAPAKPSGWMPIESAPKDGTPILLYTMGEPLKNMAVAEWNALHNRWQDPQMADEYFTDGTNWMPLPTPPPPASKEMEG